MERDKGLYLLNHKSNIIFYFVLDDVEKVGNTPIKGPLAKLSIGSLITLICISVAGLFLLIACLIVAIHRVQEGHVGVYYKNGALMADFTNPGINILTKYTNHLS